MVASSQLNRCARTKPALRRSARKESLAATEGSIGDGISVLGLDNTAAFPTISDKDVPSEVTTGVPQPMASTGGSPKPSYTEGYTKIVAPE